MKVILMLSVFLLPLLGFANIQAYQVAPCSYWMPAQNGFGFVCQNMPGQILMPEAQSTAKELKDLKARVTALENDLVLLSASCKKSEAN